MSIVRKSAAAVVVAVAVAAFAGPVAAKGKCVMAGGEGSNVLPDVAKFMADAALKNSMTAGGLKPSGKVKQNCKTDVVMTTCVSKQKACK